MARTARASAGNVCYHVLNRGNGGATVFHGRGDFAAFTALLGEARARIAMRILAFCLLPNHFHLVLWPYGDGDLSRWMQWLMTAHVRRYHRVHGTSGHVWQGRFKAFPMQQDQHFLAVVRYVERNPVPANLVERAEEWPWSSLYARLGGHSEVVPDDGPMPLPGDWAAHVNAAWTPAELDRVRDCVNRGAPFGTNRWARAAARQLGIEPSLRPRGRPPRPPAPPSAPR